VCDIISFMENPNIILPLILSLIAGSSTVVGSLIFFFIKDFKHSILSFLMGLSGGVMIYLSFMEFLPYSVETVGFVTTNILFFFGFLVMGLLDFLIPHDYIQEKIKVVSDDSSKSLLKTGIFIMIGLMLHNFPEGIAVAMSSYSNLKLGLFLTLAVAMHNIPEGIAVAVPIYYATKNKWQAFKFSFLSGIAEPIGAILALTLLGPFLNDTILSYIFAIVAGVMVFISFDELLPCCFKNGFGHVAISGIAIGMALMAITICFF